jgi:hypothetical protein
MLKVSKRFLDRAKSHFRRYQRLLASAKIRDVNESDTVVVITDFLAEVLGYDKYSEITTEFSVRSTFCDLAITLDGDLRYLIEVKSAGTDLRDNHLRQAVDYAANQGIEGVILTNGSCWHVHRVHFEQPIRSEQVLTLDLLDEGRRTADIVRDLALLSREATTSGTMEKYWKQKEATSRFVVGQLLLTDGVLRLLRGHIRHLSGGVKVTTEHLGDLLRTEVLKRDVLEGDRAEAATKLVRKLGRRKPRTSQPAEQPAVNTPPAAPPS